MKYKTKIGHAHLKVRDLDRATAFYMRYFSLQLIDMYTFNYGYMGSRTTGNAAQCGMVAGPRWQGEKPKGVSTMFRSETEFSLGLIRTQLFDAADIENVKKIQAGYRAMPLSQFQNKPAPPVDRDGIDDRKPRHAPASDAAEAARGIAADEPINDRDQAENDDGRHRKLKD